MNAHFRHFSRIRYNPLFIRQIKIQGSLSSMKRIYNSGSFDKTNIYGEFTISLHKMITVNIPHAHLTHFNKNEKLSLQESQPFKNKEVSFLQ